MTMPTNTETALASENRRLRQALKIAEDKALRFDLDQAGIERRERDAVELVELRAKVERLKKREERARNAIAKLVESIEKSDKHDDYLTRIQNTGSRFVAADLIRANACEHVAKMYCYNDTDRVAIAREAQNRACSLEREYIFDGTPCPENQHPWRQRLREWGYR